MFQVSCHLKTTRLVVYKGAMNPLTYKATWRYDTKRLMMLCCHYGMNSVGDTCPVIVTPKGMRRLMNMRYWITSGILAINT